MTTAPDPAAARLVSALASRGETVAAAESLTAGLFCATVASVPGASAVLRGGLVVYATDLKASLAGVPDDVLAADGPVAATTAAALARGARLRCGATWGVGLTGVAGPDPQDGHPPGTVFVAVSVGADSRDAGDTPRDADPDGGRVWVTRPALHGDRDTIRRGAVLAALDTVVVRVCERRPG